MLSGLVVFFFILSQGEGKKITSVKTIVNCKSQLETGLLFVDLMFISTTLNLKPECLIPGVSKGNL